MNKFTGVLGFLNKTIVYYNMLKLTDRGGIYMCNFCPFIKGECNDDCIFRGGNINLPDDCVLYDAIAVLQSLQAPGNQIDIRLSTIEAFLKNIDVNTSSDQTKSWYINNELEEIKNLLKEKL